MRLRRAKIDHSAQEEDEAAKPRKRRGLDPYIGRKIGGQQFRACPTTEKKRSRKKRDASENKKKKEDLAHQRNRLADSLFPGSKDLAAGLQAPRSPGWRRAKKVAPHQGQEGRLARRVLSLGPRVEARRLGFEKVTGKRLRKGGYMEKKDSTQTKTKKSLLGE